MTHTIEGEAMNRHDPREDYDDILEWGPLAPEHIAKTRPDYVLILPWNLKDEIMQQMSAIREWGGRFVVPVPRVQVYA